MLRKAYLPRRRRYKVGMSQMQKQYYKALLHKDLGVVNAGGERNIAMQIRKCCNHPYLFQGKMVLLDKLLPNLKERESRVLIFSQITRLLDILEDYLMYCGYLYYRIDGNTGGEDRDASIDAFNKPGSEKFIFLLSTRAGGYNFQNYNSWLQWIAGTHGLIYKLRIELIELDRRRKFKSSGSALRAYKKLALDALVIQQGRLAEQKTVNKDELFQLANDSTITDENIDRLIAKREEATAELDAKMKKFTEDAIKFKIDDSMVILAQLIFVFVSLVKDENKFDFKKIVSDNWIEPPKRERKHNYSESEYFKQTMRQSGPARPKEPRIPRMPQLHDFQFFNTQHLSELYEKEIQQTHQRNQVKDTIDVDEPEDVGDLLTTEEQEEKEQLLEEGFSA
ncbi:chromatin-remodeling protein 11 [Perilla frutescens var. frutescens]|nr:chromatin-remodeling protein 11 [Perilla frutescens var. frutescens]